MWGISTKKTNRIFCLVLLLSILSIPTTFTLAADNNEEFDIDISNGRVIDPETSLDAIRGVGIQGDRSLKFLLSRLRIDWLQAANSLMRMDWWLVQDLLTCTLMVNLKRQLTISSMTA